MTKSTAPFTKTKYEKLVKAPLKRRFKLASLKTAVRNDMTKSTLNQMKKNISKSYYFKDAPKASTFLQRRFTLGGPKTLAALKALGRRTAIGKAVNIAGKVAIAGTAAYGLHQGLKKINPKGEKKKKVQKKSTGGEIIIGRGVDLDLL